MLKKSYLFAYVFLIQSILFAQDGEVYINVDLNWLEEVSENDVIVISEKTGNKKDGYIYLRKEIVKEFQGEDKINAEEIQSLSSSKSSSRKFKKDMASMVAELNNQHTIKLEFNPILESSINRYINYKWFKDVISLFQFYEPMINSILHKYDLPEELKYIVIIESAMNPKAGSHAGAQGLWQFMPRTGKEYGLKRSNQVNLFYDPIASTDAAAQYFKRLYKIFGDWNLAISAYNCGEGRVLKDIKRAGTKNYWEVRKYLPSETRAYVPSYHAVRYLLSYYTEYNINPKQLKIHYKDVKFKQAEEEMSLTSLTLKTKKDLETLKFLNPQLLGETIPKGAIFYWY